MEFSYKLTLFECIGCGAKRAFRQLFHKSKFWRAAALILLGTVLLGAILKVAAREDVDILMLFLIAYLVLTLGAILWLVRTVTETVMVYRQCGMRERTVQIRDGSIFVINEGTKQEFLCRNILELKKSGRLYRISMTGRLGILTELYIPIRRIGDKQKQEEFRRYVNDQRKLSGDKLVAGVTETGAAETMADVEAVLGDEAGICQKWNRNTLTAAVAEEQWIIRYRMTRRRWTDWVLRNTAVFLCYGIFALVCIKTGYLGAWIIVLCVILMVFRESRTGRTISCRAVRASLEQYGGAVFEETWRLHFTPEGIQSRLPMLTKQWAWSEVGYLLESDDFYHFFTKEQRPMIYMEKDLMGDWMKQKLFVQDCQAKGIFWQVIQPEVIRDLDSENLEKEQEQKPALRVVSSATEQKSAGGKGGRTIPDTQEGWRKFWAEKEKNREDPDRLRVVVTIFAVIGIFLLAIFLPQLHSRPDFGGVPVIMDMPEDGQEYVFHPESYKNYVPLDKQIEVLESLGFVIPENMAAELKQGMEETPMSRAWVEGYPYSALISMVGMTGHDEETWEEAGYPVQAYWFDWESFDLDRDYVNILNAVNAMADGDFAITDAEQDMSGVDWEKGSGVILVRFRIDGQQCEYRMKMMSDWLDTAIIRDLNDALKKAGVEKRIYAMDDGGQGCILLCRDKEWVKQFEEATKLELEMK